MKDKCNSCGARVIRNPIWKGQEHGEKFSWDKVIWKNLFKIDLISLSIIIIVLYMAWAYNADLDQYKDIAENPCGFCANAATGCSYNQEDFGITSKVPDLSRAFEDLDIG